MNDGEYIVCSSCGKAVQPETKLSTVKTRVWLPEGWKVSGGFELTASEKSYHKMARLLCEGCLKAKQA